MSCFFTLCSCFSNMKTGGPTSLTASSLLARTVLWWYGMRTASGMMFHATTTSPSPARREQVQILLKWAQCMNLEKRRYTFLTLIILLLFRSGLQPAPSGGECTYLWQEAWEIRDQLTGEVSVPDRLYSEACPNYPLSREWTMGYPQNFLYES